MDGESLVPSHVDTEGAVRNGPEAGGKDHVPSAVVTAVPGAGIDVPADPVARRPDLQVDAPRGRLLLVPLRSPGPKPQAPHAAPG